MNVAILGATGAVGREMMKILAERSFPVEELRLLASPRSAGQKLLWQGRELTVQPAEDSAFEGMDIVLGAAENDIAKRFAPAIVKAGAVFVDNSSAFRMDPNVPLVIPEINPEDARRHKGIIANPNCTTIVSLVAINALNQDSPIQSIIASSYQAVSGAGAGGPRELMEEVELLREGKRPTVILGFNAKEEMFLEAEFAALGVPVRVTTADGSYGIRGFVTDAMADLAYSYFYTCGPMPMFRAVNQAAKTSGQFSFEERMGCGFGACMGCSCKTKYGNKRICRDGPVLEKEEIIW